MVIKWIIWLAMASAAITVLYRNLKTWGILERVARELQPNGGNTLKDKVNAAAKDSKDTLELVQDLEGRINSHEKKFASHGRAMKSIKKSVLSMASRIDKHEKDMETMFARFVSHAGRNTLNASSLLAQEEALLKIKGEPVPEGQQVTIFTQPGHVRMGDASEHMPEESNGV